MVVEVIGLEWAWGTLETAEMRTPLGASAYPGTPLKREALPCALLSPCVDHQRSDLQLQGTQQPSEHTERVRPLVHRPERCATVC